MAGFIEGIKVGARDGADAWRSFGTVSPSGLKLAALPLVAAPFCGALGLIVAGPFGMFAAFGASIVVGMLLLAYGVHLKTLGLTVPSILGVYGRPYFWSFLAAAVASTALQVTPAFLAMFLFALVAIAGLGGTGVAEAQSEGFVVAVLAFIPFAVLLSAWLYARLCLSLPATAASGSFSLAEGWHASKGRVTHVLTASMVAGFPVGVVDAVAKAALSPGVADPVSLLLTLVQVVVVSSAIANVWRTIGREGKTPVVDHSIGFPHRF